MQDVLKLVGAFVWSRCRSRAARDVEILFLRQQLIILRRSAPVSLPKISSGLVLVKRWANLPPR